MQLNPTNSICQDNNKTTTRQQQDNNNTTRQQDTKTTNRTKKKKNKRIEKLGQSNWFGKKDDGSGKKVSGGRALINQ
jgi:hypothetical protein